MQLANTVKTFMTNAKTYWKVPAAGKYMPYKEIAAYSGGGIGVYCIIVVVNAMLLSTSNTLIGNTIGIDPRRMYLLYVLAILASIPLTGLRANIIDNSRGKNGRYRPYLMKMGIPAVLLSVGFVWMPYARMSMVWKCITVLLFNIGFQFFFNFFRDSYENLICVLSPNSQERTDVISFKSIIYSVAPTIINPLMPLLANLLTNGDLNDIRLYKYAYPPIAVLGILLTSIVYIHTREKTVQAKTHVVQIKFLDALREVAKNKYFWVISCAGWIGFLEGAQATILYWLYQYYGGCSAGTYAAIIFIYGDAALWGMLAAPFAVRRFGKRKVLVTTNLLNIVFILALYPFVHNIWLVLLFMYANGLVGSFAVVLNPSIEADIRDYQHYVTGERIDGMFATVGLIGSIIGIVTQGVLPQIYARGGIALDKALAILDNPAIMQRMMPSGSTVGQILADRAAAAGVSLSKAVNAYDALYDPAIFTSLIHILILVSACGALLNLLPYFFYDLTETRQRGMIQVLKIRAFFEDYGNGILTDKNLVETIDEIREAEALAQETPAVAAKPARSGSREARRAQKKECKRILEHNKKIEIAHFTMLELDKFRNGSLDGALAQARATVGGGLRALENFDPAMRTQARALPHATAEEKKARREALLRAKKFKIAAKTCRKYFPEGLASFDTQEHIRLCTAYDALEEQLAANSAAYVLSKKEKRREDARRLADEARPLQAQRRQTDRDIRRSANRTALYNRAAKPFLEAQKLLLQKENYENYDRIHALYDEAKARLDSAR